MAVNEDEARHLLCRESDLLIHIESSSLGLESITSSYYALLEPLARCWHLVPQEVWIWVGVNQ